MVLSIHDFSFIGLSADGSRFKIFDNDNFLF